MPDIIVHGMGNGAFANYQDRELIHLGDGAPPIRIVLLKHGMKSGKPSVGIVLELPLGEVVIAETSLQVFLAAADALRALVRC